MLGIIRLTDPDGATVGIYDNYSPPEAPPDDSITLMDMPERILGVHLIVETQHRAGQIDRNKVALSNRRSREDICRRGHFEA